MTGPQASRSVPVLVDACSHRIGGGVTYLSNLLPLLERQPGIGPVVAIVEPPSPLVDALAGTRVRVESRRGPGGLAARVLWEGTRLGRRARGAVLVSPNAMLPWRLPVETVVVPHNILPFVSSQPRAAIQRAAIRRTLRWASGVIFVSEYMRSQVRPLTPVPRIERVIPHGLAEPFLAPPPARTNRQGIVAVADRYPHKRLALVIAAWRQLGEPRPELRILGADGPRSEAESGVLFEQGLSPLDVARRLGTARLVVIPSLAESFGLPALEALACETPLVASDIGALREVTAGHATLVQSSRAESWAQAIRSALEAPPPAGPGRAWATSFTWERSATATAGLLLEAFTQRTGRRRDPDARPGTPPIARR